MKVFQLDIKSYTDFILSQSIGTNIYAHPAWFIGMSRHPFVFGCFDEQQQLVAVWPFNKVKRSLGTECLSQPIFCQSLGPIFSSHLSETRSSPATKSLFRKIIKVFCTHIFDNGYTCLSQGLPINFSLAHYFYHLGLELNYRITYRIPSDRKLETQWEEMHSDHRRKIKKSLKRYKIIENGPVAKLWSMKKNSLSKSQRSMFPSLEKFSVAVETLIEKEKGSLIGLQDDEDQWRALAFFGEDANSVYYLVGFTEKRTSNESHSLAVLWWGIERALNSGKNFDFEGTMLPQLDRTFRRFNPVAIPYARLEWDRTWTGQLKTAWKKWRSANN
jgi:hypothetical protein